MPPENQCTRQPAGKVQGHSGGSGTAADALGPLPAQGQLPGGDLMCVSPGRMWQVPHVRFKMSGCEGQFQAVWCASRENSWIPVGT